MMRTITYWLAVAAIVVNAGVYVRLDQGGSTLGKFFAVPLIVSWVLYRLSSRSLRVFGNWQWWALGIVSLGGLSLFWSRDVDGTTYDLSRYVVGMVMAFIIWDLSITRKEAQGLVQAFLGATYLAFATQIVSAAAGSSAIEDRFSAAGEHADSAGFYSMLGVPFAWYFATDPAPMKPFIRFLCALLPIVALMMTVLSATRAGVVLGVVVFSYILFNLRRGPGWVRYAVFAAIGLFCVMALLGTFNTQLGRLATTGSSLFTDLGGRLELWLTALAIFAKNPLIGVGMGAFPQETMHYAVNHFAGNGYPTHNVYLQYLADLGIVGFGLLCGFFVSLWQPIRRAPKSVKVMAGFSFLTLLLGNGQIPVFNQMPVWIFIGVFSGYAASVGARTASKPVPAPIQQLEAPSYA
jgi:O-antigen ligase